ncbi:hypothetical protein EOM86_12625, partial [Candidatus Nomurabacteria bacterium]|nr:hypothetical protein [Candidatus Nomurabacteria bacterium]
MAVMKAFDLIEGTVKEDTFGNFSLSGGQAILDYVLTDKLKIFSYLDTTFLLNPDKTPGIAFATAQSFPAGSGNLNKLFVTIKGGKYGHTYKIIINGTEIATRTTPNGSTTDDAPYIATDSIAKALYANFYERNSNSNSGSVTGATITGSYDNNKSRSYIMFDLVSTNGTEPVIEVNDGFGGENITYVYNGYVKRKEDIPDIGNNHGDLMFKVIGSTETGADDMYVRFENGYWKESTVSALSFNQMPCRLTIAADGTPTIGYFGWIRREVGDDDSNPPPSFINKNIRDICLFRNRLAFLTEDTICLSQSGDMFNFWRSTTADVLDSDPIDLNVMAEDSVDLNFMTTLQDNLILMSNKNQFALTTTGGVLTPKTARVTEISKYSNDSSFIKPIMLGRKLYFTNNREGFSHLNEYYDMG